MTLLPIPESSSSSFWAVLTPSAKTQRHAKTDACVVLESLNTTSKSKHSTQGRGYDDGAESRRHRWSLEIPEEMPAKEQVPPPLELDGRLSTEHIQRTYTQHRLILRHQALMESGGESATKIIERSRTREPIVSQVPRSQHNLGTESMPPETDSTISVILCISSLSA
ncbi:hypothetical protein SODALDRAFT_360434 [Sodiomyces alkalinus F11]|uniref:Uncharacterized protein n=1 Tax=Sodiomyces alkalinus (strain CBS 110278 / VKM F-3762 / F11) TaxID=1314773 RepID=A0A3N2PUD9_SODAK|nr:hypothetical protein SODALDRAFT_360434 [Sodiomyces alkalinus F11]ROT38101.1 hypothetical protein SODALDRAFT_360434 [Sodiomyces alkalinus F11]